MLSGRLKRDVKTLNQTYLLFQLFFYCLQQGYITDDVMVSVSPSHYPEFTLSHFVEKQLKVNQS